MGVTHNEETYSLFGSRMLQYTYLLKTGP